MSEAIVTAQGVSKWYGQVIGLNDVTVSVPPGITGLLGPNGAGKSTFMKLMTGQLKPSKGDVRVLGEPMVNGSIAQRVNSSRLKIRVNEERLLERSLAGRQKMWIVR